MAIAITAGQVAAVQEVDLPESLVITLERTRCFGTCPAYTVSIDAKGHVTYQGKDFVRVKDHATATIPVTDLPTTFVSVTRAGRTKRVEDYVGAPSPDPDAIQRRETVDAFFAAGRSRSAREERRQAIHQFHGCD